MGFWPEYCDELKQRIEGAEDEQQALRLKKHLKRVQQTEVCVVVSSEQNEVKKFKKLELDIASHREKIVKRDLKSEFQDAENPFRLAFVCAMWITGFDAPCVSTVYLDKPIRDTLSKKEESAVKKVAKMTLETLKAEKLKLEHWRESTQVSAQVKVTINQSLQHLPQVLMALDTRNLILMMSWCY